MRYGESSKIGEYGESNAEFIISSMLISDMIKQIESGESLNMFNLKSAKRALRDTKRQMVDRVDLDTEFRNINTNGIVKRAIDVKVDRKAYKTGNIYVELPLIQNGCGCADLVLFILTNFAWKPDYTIPDEKNITATCIMVRKLLVKELVEHANPQYSFRNKQRDEHESGYLVPIKDICRLDKATVTTQLNNASFQPGHLLEVTLNTYCP